MSTRDMAQNKMILFRHAEQAIFTSPLRDLEANSALQNLHATAEALRDATYECQQIQQGYFQALKACDPAAWKLLAEAAIMRADFQLSGTQAKEGLRIRFTEALLTYEGYRLKYKVAVDRLSVLTRLLGTAKQEAMLAASHIDEASQQRLQHYKRLLRSTVLEAASVEATADLPDDTHKQAAIQDKHTLKALKTAFVGIVETVETLKQRNHFHSKCGDYHFNMNAATSCYPAARVNAWRNVPTVPFVDCIFQPGHPACQALSQMLLEVEELRSVAALYRSQYKDQGKGRVNEHPHSQRMLDWIMGDYPDDAAVMQCKAQKTNRMQYDQSRSHLLAAIIGLLKLRADLVTALDAAVLEVQPFIEATEDRLESDIRLSRRLALLNCITADYVLRQLGAELLELHELFIQDLTMGSADKAAEEEYQNSLQS